MAKFSTSLFWQGDPRSKNRSEDWIFQVNFFVVLFRFSSKFLKIFLNIFLFISSLMDVLLCLHWR